MSKSIPPKTIADLVDLIADLVGTARAPARSADEEAKRLRALALSSDPVSEKFRLTTAAESAARQEKIARLRAARA